MLDMYTDILLHVGRISIDWSVFISQSPTNWLWGMSSPIGRPSLETHHHHEYDDPLEASVIQV